jgi:hypothetical protein
MCYFRARTVRSFPNAETFSPSSSVTPSHMCNGAPLHQFLCTCICCRDRQEHSLVTRFLYHRWPPTARRRCGRTSSSRMRPCSSSRARAFMHELHLAEAQREVVYKHKVDQAVGPSAVIRVLQSILHAQNPNIPRIQELSVDFCEHGNAVGAQGTSDDVAYVLTRFHGISSVFHLLQMPFIFSRCLSCSKQRTSIVCDFPLLCVQRKDRKYLFSRKGALQQLRKAVPGRVVAAIRASSRSREAASPWRIRSWTLV